MPTTFAFEDELDFLALKAGFHQDFAPRTTYQKFLTDQLAIHAWRILRSQQVEIQLQETLLSEITRRLGQDGRSAHQGLEDRPFAGLALTLHPPPRDPHNHLLKNLFRYCQSIQTQFHRTRQALLESLKMSPCADEAPAKLQTDAVPNDRPVDRSRRALQRQDPSPRE